MTLSSEGNRQNDLYEMLMYLGDTYLGKGLAAEAAKKYELLIELNYKNKGVYSNLSKALIALKRFDKNAFEIYQQAIEYEPDNAKLSNILAVSYLKEGREDYQAVQIYELAARHQTPVFDKLSEFLGTIYFKHRDFPKCKQVTETLLRKSGFRPQAFHLFLQSCWRLVEFDDAIAQIKTLLHTAENKFILLRYLCITYLEKKFALENQDQKVRFSSLDRRLIIDYLRNNATFERLHDLSLYLDLRRILNESEYWEDRGTAAGEVAESALVYQSMEEFADYQEEGKTYAPKFTNAMGDILGKLSSFEDLSGISVGARSSLTYEDFQEKGLNIFSDADTESKKLGLPENVEILITIEFAQYDQLLVSFGIQQVEQVRKRLFAILTDLLAQYQFSYIWGTNNGLLIFTSGIVPAVAFATELQNKLNRYNYSSEPKDEIHIAIGIHHARNTLDELSETTIRELTIGLKLGIDNVWDLPGEIKPEYTKIFRKAGRIFLSGKAYREIKSSNRFKVNTVGQFRVKYLSESLSFHEVVWRNPLDVLRFGNIRRLGRFDLLAELNSKGLFRVYKAKDSVLHRMVLLKVVQSEAFNELAVNSEAKRDFCRLAKAHGSVSHPNIANIYEVDEDEGLTYIAREFVEGVPITELFKDFAQFNAQRLLQFILHICKGLNYCHQLGLYHLNLKPNNIRVGSYDEIKIMDYLVPRELFSDQGKLEEDVKGYAYHSPEQVQNAPMDGRSDIFSLGVILYQLVTQINPFAGTFIEDIREAILYKKHQLPTKINNQLPKFLEALILKCLEKKPEQRYQTVYEIISDVKRAFSRGVLSNFNYHVAQSRNSS